MRADSLRTKLASGLICALATVILLSAASPAAWAATKPWEKFKYPELRDINLPDYERHVLENGMVLFIMEDHEWPLVEGEFIVRTGSAYEPGSKVGLASVTGDVLRSGGTTSIVADDLDTMLEAMGGQIESSIGETSGQLSFSFLSKDAARGMELVADVIRNPAFEEDKIDVALTGQRAGIARRNDELFGIVARELDKAVWGEDHPYARHAEYETLDSISRDDLVQFYEYFYHPNNMIMIVTGDISTKEALSTVNRLFGDWPRVENEIPALPDKPTPGTRRVMVANKDDVTQSRVAVGHTGMKRNDPDYYAMSVMNRILGGGFGDRLFNEVRSNLGLAYNVGSTDGASWSRVGTFQAYVGTKNETVDQALGAVLGEIDKMREGEVTPGELADAKEAILNSHVFNFASKEQIVSRKAYFEYLGYPEDYLETYPKKVKNVSAQQVQDVAKRRLDPDQFAVVAVGKTDEWDGDLSTYGPVEELDISIPEPEGEQFPAPTAETIELGRAALAAARQAHGGNAVSGVTSMKRSDSIGITMGGMELAATSNTTILYPDQMHTALMLPFGEMLQVVGKDAVWNKSPQGIQDITGDDAQDQRLQIMEDPIYVLGNFDNFQVQALANETVNDVETKVVLVWLSEEKWYKMFFDSASNVLVKAEAMGKHPMNQTPGLQEFFFSNVKKIGGVNIPHATEVVHAGEKIFTVETTKIELNPRVDASLFEKPAS